MTLKFLGQEWELGKSEARVGAIAALSLLLLGATVKWAVVTNDDIEKRRANAQLTANATGGLVRDVNYLLTHDAAVDSFVAARLRARHRKPLALPRRVAVADTTQAEEVGLVRNLGRLAGRLGRGLGRVFW